MEYSDVAVKTAVAIFCVGIFGGGAVYLTQRPASPSPSTAVIPSKRSVATAKPRSLDLQHERWLRQAEEAHELLDESLPDYPSARFKNVHGIVYGAGMRPRDYVLCGQINAKNRVGAYVGYKQFSISYSLRGDAIRIHFDNNDDWIAKSYCDGKGTAGEKMAAENRKLLNRPLDFERDIRPLMEDLVEGRVKPAPVLKHTVSRKDYAAEISFSHKVGAALSDAELWP